MRLSILLFLFLTIIFTACTNEPAKNVAVNSTVGNTGNKPTANSNSPLATNKAPEAATANSAETLSPVVNGYYQALQKRDETAVKKYLSAAALKYYEDEAKTEKKNWLAFLTEYEDPISEKREVRNEKIEGETATAELRGGSLGVWTKMKFIKENGEWKFASPADSEELKGVSK